MIAYRRGRRVRIAAMLCAVAAGAAACSDERPPPPDEAVRIRLASIMTATGQSALERMEACDLRIDWDDSWFVLMATDADQADLVQGDQVLSVRFTAPNRPNQAPGRTEARARWRFRGEDVTPRNDWATAIQQAKPPMVSSYYLNC